MSTGNNPTMEGDNAPNDPEMEEDNPEMEEDENAPNSISACEFVNDWLRSIFALGEQVSDDTMDWIQQELLFIESLSHQEWQEHYLEHLRNAMIQGEPSLCEPLREYFDQLQFHSDHHDIKEDWDVEEEWDERHQEGDSVGSDEDMEEPPEDSITMIDEDVSTDDEEYEPPER